MPECSCSTSVIARARRRVGYQQNLSESRLPFIFRNASGLQRDVETIFARGAGTRFMRWLTRDEDLYAYRSGADRILRSRSMSMGIARQRIIGEFTPDEMRWGRRAEPTGRRSGGGPTQSRREPRAAWSHLEGIIGMFPWVANGGMPFRTGFTRIRTHTREERRTAWARIDGSFWRPTWTGRAFLKTREAHLWHRQLHIFISSVSTTLQYGIAQLGALQVWANSNTLHRVKALNDYKKALALAVRAHCRNCLPPRDAGFEFSTTNDKAFG